MGCIIMMKGYWYLEITGMEKILIYCRGRNNIKLVLTVY